MLNYLFNYFIWKLYNSFSCFQFQFKDKCIHQWNDHHDKALIFIS